MSCLGSEKAIINGYGSCIRDGYNTGTGLGLEVDWTAESERLSEFPRRYIPCHIPHVRVTCTAGWLNSASEELEDGWIM